MKYWNMLNEIFKWQANNTTFEIFQVRQNCKGKNSVENDGARKLGNILKPQWPEISFDLKYLQAIYTLNR